MHFYSGKENSIAHFDLWRLQDEQEFINLGLEEYLTQGVVLIEWPDRITHLLPPNTLFVAAKVHGEGREVSIYTGEFLQ